MSVLGVRTELIVGATTGIRTGLIWLTKIGTGAAVESNSQVLAADQSTLHLGRAIGAVVPSIPMAINDRQDDTGVATSVVPNVVGLTQAAAAIAITGVGLIVGTVTGTVDPVLSQDPVATTVVASGSAVDLTLTS